MKLGMGVSPFTYWQTDQKCVNLIDPRITVPPPRVAGATYDNFGWPKSLPAGKFTGWYLIGTEGYVRPGTYRLDCRGSGTIHLGVRDLVATPSRGDYTIKGPADGSYRTVCEFEIRDPPARTLFGIFKTDPANPVRDFRLYRVGDDPAYLFRADYVKELARFDTLRLAAWPGVIASKEIDWPAFAGDPYGKPQHWAAGFAGCGQARCNPWVNIPHMASDRYTTEVARLAQSMLGGRGLKVYAEYSIEIWNWGYPFNVATDWVRKWGERQAPPVDYLAAYATLAAHHQDVFAAAAPGLPLVRMVACQWGWPDLARWVLQYSATKGFKFSTLAVAPYVDCRGLDWRAVDPLLTEADGDPTHASFQAALDLVFEGYARDLIAMESSAAAYQAIAKKFGVELVCYEVGPSWTIPPGSPPHRLRLYDASHADRRMGTFLSESYFPWLQSRGFTLAMYTQHTARHGPGSYWGVKSYADESPCPKWDACVDWCSANNGKA